MLNSKSVKQAGANQTAEVRALYERASQDEMQFLRVLQSLGYDARPSTTEQDRYEDIDLVLLKDYEMRTVSLKTTRHTTDRVPLELRAWYAGSDTEVIAADSWFWTSKADVFAFETDGLYYLFDARVLRDYVLNHMGLTPLELEGGRRSIWVNGDKIDMTFLSQSTIRNSKVIDSFTLWFTPYKHPQAGLLGVISTEGKVKYTVGDDATQLKRLRPSQKPRTRNSKAVR
jgi:hypothetical protein